MNTLVEPQVRHYVATIHLRSATHLDLERLIANALDSSRHFVVTDVHVEPEVEGDTEQTKFERALRDRFQK